MQRAPLSVKNTAPKGIPKPSRLAQPGSLLPRKRPLNTSPPQDEGTLFQGKEVSESVRQ